MDEYIYFKYFDHKYRMRKSATILGVGRSVDIWFIEIYDPYAKRYKWCRSIDVSSMEGIESLISREFYGAKIYEGTL